MELAFTILAGIGALIFLSGYLGFVFAGFKHHFVTGIISALPVLNIVTVPALWRNASRKVFSSIIGLIIFIASWFLGANTGVSKYIGLLKGEQKTTQTTIVGSPIDANITATTSAQASYSGSQRTIDESKLQLLPKKPLYRMEFKNIPINKIQSLNNRVIKIITIENNIIDGRVDSVKASSIVINGSELPITNIKQISLMVKKAN